MTRQPAPRRAQRLQEIARQVGAVLGNFDATPLERPARPRTFMVPDDERKADVILSQLRIDAASNQQSSRRHTLAFNRGQKPGVYQYVDIYNAMAWVIQDNGLPGVLEALLRRFKQMDGNINLARRSSSGMVRRVRGKEEQEERGRLLYLAAERCRLDYVQILCPLADQQSLDEALAVSLPKRALDVIEVLVRYGANTGLYEPTLVYAASHGDHEFLEILLRAQKKVSQLCLDQSLLPAASCGSLRSVLLLTWAGANAEHDGASALMEAVDMVKEDLATALVGAQKPPSGTSLDKALMSMFTQPSSPAPITDGQYLLMEALLCGGPAGDAANQGLVRATMLANTRMMHLLLSHQADINFDGGCAVGHAIQKNRSNLLGTLLQNQSLNPEVASELVSRIPQKIPPMDKVAILSKLLVNGATGAHCSQQLVLATESNDLETAQLLVTYGTQNHASSVCSVNYNGARSLKTAVTRNNIPMVKLLALEGDPNKFSLGQAFSSIPPNLSGDDHFLIVQTLLRAGATGPQVDEALQSAVTSHRKSHRLIEVLVQFKANVTEPILIAAVAQASTTIVDILLAGNVTSGICAAAIPAAMKLPMNKTRFDIISKLLGPISAASLEAPECSQAMIDILQNCPEDVTLLNLLCRVGKANPNSEDGLALVLATKQSKLDPLKVLLQSGNTLPTFATIEKALDCAINLPLADASRSVKIKALLMKVKPQEAMNKALIKEIESSLKDGQQSPVIPVLLDAGADINAQDAASLRLSVNNPAIMNLLLMKGPSPRSVSLIFPAAITLKEPARVALCEKLLRAGAAGEEISKALCAITEEGQIALPLMRLIIPHADVNSNQGYAVQRAVQQVFTEGLDLLLCSHPSIPSPATRAGAFLEAMKLKTSDDRHDMVERLLKTGIPGVAISDALIIAANLGDLRLSELLMQNGGSVEHKGGQAVRSAASSGNCQMLRLLLSSKPSLSTLTTGLGGAVSLEGEPRYQILQILLEAGLRGEAVDDALIESVKQGDSNLRMTQLLCNNGASIEWKEGEAIVIVASSAMPETLELLLGREPTEIVLRRAYIAASHLNKDQRIQTLERLLAAGKQIDNHVTKTLTTATMEKPSDLQMIKMLLARGIFDGGESMVHAASVLDLRTLSLLLSSSEAQGSICTAFSAIPINDSLWQSATGLAVVKLLLEKGATGIAVAEALYQAVASLERNDSGTQILASQFIDVFLKFNADVNHEHGITLQRATLHANLPLIQKLLPLANPDSKAMSLPYIFTACDDKATVLKCLSAFAQSFDDGPDSLDTVFQHPDEDLEPILFLALNKFPRDTQILGALLEMGYAPNQWQFCASKSDVQPEHWPILCWALDQAEKRVSSAVIGMLIDAGANINFTSKTGITPLMLAIHGQRVDIVTKLIEKGVDVTAETAEGITPLALASSLNNLALMECLLEAEAEVDDGSLHDVTSELRIDKMSLLLKYGHRVDYPSDRHGGRSALAELCLKAVDHDPSVKQLEKAIQFLINKDANVGLRNVNGKTIFHYAMDSSNPILILTALLKLMWEHINTDIFLYTDQTYTYSLTKYVEKDLFKGPPNQKEPILTLLRKKQAIDRFWAHDILVAQPPDYCKGPPHIEEEVLRQKARIKRQAEMEEDAKYLLNLKRITAISEVEISAITAAGDIQRAKEKARIDQELMLQSANTQLQITQDAFNLSSRHHSLQQQADLRHAQHLTDVQLNLNRQLKQEEIETDRTKNVMQIEFIQKKEDVQNSAWRQRLAIEEQSKENVDRIGIRQHEREMARIKLQKNLVEQQQMLAGSFVGGVPGQRQIGFVDESMRLE